MTCEFCGKDRPCVNDYDREGVNVAVCHECATPPWLSPSECDECAEAEAELADILLGVETV